MGPSFTVKGEILKNTLWWLHFVVQIIILDKELVESRNLQSIEAKTVGIRLWKFIPDL